MEFNRRQAVAGMAAATAFAPTLSGTALARKAPGLPAFFADIEHRTFRYFWELSRDDNGLTPDRWPTPSFASIAAVGFALTAYPIGVENGWITRAQARARTLATLRFFDSAPQGDDPVSASGHKGFFYHFLQMDSGLRFRQTELSSVDTTLLFLGIVYAGGWYDGDDTDEKEIRRLADQIVERADWKWFQRGRGDVSMGWHPEEGFIDRGWTAYNEGMMVALLALGAESHPVGDDAWAAWTATLAPCWRGEGATRHIAFAPLFGHQYSHVWYDFRGIRDEVNRQAGFDYFENSRRATLADRAYCIANPMGFAGYSRNIWGLTACDGPGNYTIMRGGVEREIYGYSARGPMGQPDGRDDGTLSPTAALGSLPFAPEVVVPAAKALKQWPGLYRDYGFADSFNPSVTDPTLKLETGSVDPKHGWIATDYLGIDQGPILAMAANYRREAVWRVMRRVPRIRRGLQRAGFTGGWLAASAGA